MSSSSSPSTTPRVYWRLRDFDVRPRHQVSRVARGLHSVVDRVAGLVRPLRRVRFRHSVLRQLDRGDRSHPQPTLEQTSMRTKTRWTKRVASCDGEDTDSPSCPGPLAQRRRLSWFGRRSCPRGRDWSESGISRGPVRIDGEVNAEQGAGEVGPPVERRAHRRRPCCRTRRLRLRRVGKPRARKSARARRGRVHYELRDANGGSLMEDRNVVHPVKLEAASSPSARPACPPSRSSSARFRSTPHRYPERAPS